MTVSYSAEVPNGSSFGVFWKILLKWRGSVYKLIWRELLAYLGLYYTINLVYRYGLKEDQKVIFEKIRQYFAAQGESIPMSFVLGFYVSLIVKRWWEQYKLLPWPDTLALFISAAIPGNAETGRLMRRNIMRYAVLAYVITLQRISLRVKRRFPSWQHIVDAGLMLESEKKIFEIMDGKSPMSKYWMPLVWATNIINRARKDCLISSDHIVQTLLMELSDIRRRLGALIGYDTVNVPLVYTQVVTLVLYTYFIAALMGRQMVPRGSEVPTGKYEDPDLYFPLFTALQFCFYVGWLKVAEVLINPFGEDDDDFELNWLIDRHIKASYMIVDEMHEEHPELLKDQYWEEVVPKELPYTVASEHYRRSEPKGSAELYKIKESDAVYANIIPTKRMLADDVYADYESVDTPMVERRKNWFSRQITRMGSVRSSSTAYSSGGLFGRNRHNSVYSSPEAGIVNPASAIHPKMSFYDKFVGRKSLRAQQRHLMKRDSKLSLNGNVMGSGAPQKNRPRIPTPDVAKEITESSRFAITTFNSVPITSATTISGQSVSDGVQQRAIPSSIASGVALMTQQLANTPSMYPGSTMSTDWNGEVVGTFLLSPIKEMDSSSVNNTLQIGHPATNALAQAILPKNLTAAGFGSVRELSNAAIATTFSVPVVASTSPASSAATNTVSVLSMVLPTAQNNSTPTYLPNETPYTPTTTIHTFPTTHSNIIITELPADIPDAPESSPGNISRSNSGNNLAPPPMNHHQIERKSSLNAKSTNSPILTSGKLKEIASAPSTLTKAKTEAKGGEVYV